MLPMGPPVEGAEGPGQEGCWAGSPEASLQLCSSKSGGTGPGGTSDPCWVEVGLSFSFLLEADQLTGHMEMVAFY